MNSTILKLACALAIGLTSPALSRSAEIEAAEHSLLPGPFTPATQPDLKQSLFAFGGWTNSGNLWNTFSYGVGAPQPKFYDNYIVGGAYQRDLVKFNSGFLIGAELGLADRFGHYKVCCDGVVYSDAAIHSVELWGGVALRHEGFNLFDTINISPGVVFGLSGISNPIGQEGLHQNFNGGSAKVLFYLGFDLAFALANMPNTELVFRVHHRSGAYGTLGNMKEGNNANVVGIRMRF